MKVMTKEVHGGYIIYILDEHSGRPIQAKTVNSLEEAKQTEKEFKKNVASMK
jgi:hypothetical protein